MTIKMKEPNKTKFTYFGPMVEVSRNYYPAPDGRPPQITSPSDVTVNADPGRSEASSVDLGTPVVSDSSDQLCPGSATVTGERSDGKGLSEPYPVGVTTIT